nr:hypothetical protein [Devosia sp. Root685]
MESFDPGTQIHHGIRGEEGHVERVIARVARELATIIGVVVIIERADEQVVAGTAEDGVIAVSAIHEVIARAAEETIMATFAIDQIVVVIAAKDIVIAIIGKDDIATRPSVDKIVTGTGPDYVHPGIGDDVVGPGKPEHQVAARGAEQHVILWCAKNRTTHNRRIIIVAFIIFIFIVVIVVVIAATNLRAFAGSGVGDAVAIRARPTSRRDRCPVGWQRSATRPRQKPTALRSPRSQSRSAPFCAR